ncbi:MAG: gliding motility-associated C-terminal domain-containing protein [Thermonemataceae bacterium]|nr:gliding motility-associated C-terminal domain-containing protein [Thermonemataceae bacterium]
MKNLFFFFLTIFYLGGKSLFAQTACFFADGYPPAISQVKVCLGKPITMNDANCTDFKPSSVAPRRYRFAPNLPISISNTNTYTETGVFTVRFYGNKIDALGGQGDSVTRENYVQVLPTPKPKVLLERCNNKQIKVKITEFAPYTRYKVNFGNGHTDYIYPSNNPLLYTYPSSNTYNINIVGEHDLTGSGGFDTGINADTTANLLIFNDLSSLAATLGAEKSFPNSACNGKITIKITETSPDLRYEIWLKKNTDAPQLLKVVEKEKLQNFLWEVSELNTLGNSYQVQILLKDACNNLYNFNQTFLSYTLPLEVKGLNASFEADNTLKISWKDPQRAEEEFRNYQIRLNGQSVANTSNLEYNLGTNLDKNCYTVDNITSCGVQTLFSQTVCPMILSWSEPSPQEYHLTWNPYKNSDNEEVIAYQVVKLNGIAGAIDNFSAGTNTNYLDTRVDKENQVVQYKILAQTASGEYFSNTIRIERPAKFFLPEAFTPNGDNLNDIFTAKGLFIKTLQLEIFTLNGQKLFESSVLGEGWDGSFSGKMMPAGVYMYVCSVEDFLGKQLKKTGTFLLQR